MSLDTKALSQPPSPSLTVTARQALTLLVLFALTIVCGLVVSASWPVLLRDHPLLLIALDARNRWLLLTSSRIGTPEFVAVAVASRFAVDPLFYLVGRWLGPVLESSMRGRLVDLTRRLFAKASCLAVAAFPGPLVCLLAGDSGMRPRRFLALNLSGTLVTVVSLRVFAGAIQPLIAPIVAFNERYAGRLLWGSIALTIVWQFAKRRKAPQETTQP